MATYKVGMTCEGAKVWWAHWQAPHGLAGTEALRDATDEEAALMEKVVWDRDNPSDLDRLKELLQRS
jgi:hypothetical protein